MNRLSYLYVVILSAAKNLLLYTGSLCLVYIANRRRFITSFRMTNLAYKNKTPDPIGSGVSKLKAGLYSYPKTKLILNF
jgi:hypothetical protein